MIDYDLDLNIDDGGRWLEKHPNGWVLKYGKHHGEFIDDVPESYVSWILESADFRPTPKEELILREAIGEIKGHNGRQQGEHDWHSVIVGKWSFKIPEAVAQKFDDEMRRMLQLTKSPVTAFEAIIANSAITSIEELQ